MSIIRLEFLQSEIHDTRISLQRLLGARLTPQEQHQVHRRLEDLSQAENAFQKAVQTVRDRLDECWDLEDELLEALTPLGLPS